MEISAATFIAMRDVGCMTTQHVTTGRSKGMLVLTNAGLHHLLAGKSVVKLLQHYCCSRFDTPAELQPEDGDSAASKRHNWAIASKILKDALSYELAWERRELIIQGDIVEVVVLLKQIQDLVAVHRLADKEERLRHRLMSENPHHVEIATRLSKPFTIGETKSPPPHERPWLVGASKKPPAKLPPLPVRAPKRMKPLLPPEAKRPPAATPEPEQAADRYDHDQQRHAPARSRTPHQEAPPRRTQQQQQQQRTITLTEDDL